MFDRSSKEARPFRVGSEATNEVKNAASFAKSI